MPTQDFDEARLLQLVEKSRRQHAEWDAALMSGQYSPMTPALLFVSCHRYGAYLARLGRLDEARLAFHQGAALGLALERQGGDTSADPLSVGCHRSYLSALFSDNPELIRAYVEHGTNHERWEDHHWIARAAFAALRRDASATRTLAADAEAAASRAQTELASSEDPEELRPDAEHISRIARSLRALADGDPAAIAGAAVAWIASDEEQHQLPITLNGNALLKMAARLGIDIDIPADPRVLPGLIRVEPRATYEDFEVVRQWRSER